MKRKAPCEKTGGKCQCNKVGIKTGHHAIVSGATGQGKTRYVVDAILGTGPHRGMKADWDRIIVVCPALSRDQMEYQRLKANFKGKGKVRFMSRLPQNDDEMEGLISMLKDGKKAGYQTLMLVDDMMTSTRKGPEMKYLDQLYTSARHQNTDLWELVQNPCHVRTRRLQVGYMICFDTPADRNSFRFLANQMDPMHRQSALEAYHQAIQKKHGCLVVCLNEPDNLRYRNTNMQVGMDVAGSGGPALSQPVQELGRKRRRNK